MGLAGNELDQVDGHVHPDPDEDEGRERRYDEADFIQKGCHLVLLAFRVIGGAVTGL